MSVTFFSDFQSNPAETMRKRLIEVWAQVDRQAEATAKAAEQERYRAAYAKRREPTEPNNAA